MSTACCRLVSNRSHLNTHTHAFIIIVIILITWDKLETSLWVADTYTISLSVTVVLNDLSCVDGDVKPYSLTHSLTHSLLFPSHPVPFSPLPLSYLKSPPHSFPSPALSLVQLGDLGSAIISPAGAEPSLPIHVSLFWLVKHLMTRDVVLLSLLVLVIYMI